MTPPNEAGDLTPTDAGDDGILGDAANASESPAAGDQALDVAPDPTRDAAAAAAPEGDHGPVDGRPNPPASIMSMSSGLAGDPRGLAGGRGALCGPALDPSACFGVGALKVSK